MLSNKIASLLLMAFAAATAMAQVVSPIEIKDTELRSLQQQYLQVLTQAGRDILANHFDYPFYFSRRLDLNEAQQLRTDQHSLRFDQFEGQTIVAVTGNYYAAYSGEKMNDEERARTSFLNVVLPILKALVPPFRTNQVVQGYAVEISHHVIMKVMGMPVERPENLMVFFPKGAAIKLVEARDTGGLQAALLDAQVFVNAEPLSIWLDGQTPHTVVDIHRPGSRTGQAQSTLTRTETQLAEAAVQGSQSEPSSPLAGSMMTADIALPGASPRDISSEALAALQTSNKDLIDRIVKELDSQAHFVSYAPPAFIGFRRGIYLEFSTNTALTDFTGSSRYKLAALAFDEHIARLIRPFAGYFKDDQVFDGIAFSTSVRVLGKSDPVSRMTEAVEFFFPFRAMHCYARYDCTGQQLIDAGTVLINGERVGLDLQKAETDGP